MKFGLPSAGLAMAPGFDQPKLAISVPEGQVRVAQRFIAGLEVDFFCPRPGGTLEPPSESIPKILFFKPDAVLL